VLNKTLCVLFICRALVIPAKAQELRPEIQNYSIEDYSAHNQNWGIDIDAQGTIYIANNKGLLRYNGASWQLYELPNRTIIRSVFVDKDIIFTGSYEEFGYWKYDNFRNLKYTSLSHLFHGVITNDEFWQIIKHKNDIILRSFGKVFIYNNNQILPVQDSQDVLDLTVYKNEVIVGIKKKGLHKLKGDRLIPFFPIEAQYQFNQITNIASNDDTLFFYDRDKGAFIVRDKEVIKLPQKITSRLKAFVLNKVIFLERDKIVFGTIKKGIVVYDLKTEETQHIHKQQGLTNNTVLGISSSKESLWCALDVGISNINWKDKYQYYIDQTGDLASVYDMIKYNDNYYLASNTGLYSFDANNNLNFIKNSEGHIWNLNIIDDYLFCGHNKGGFYLQGGVLKEVKDSQAGVYSYAIPFHRDNAYLMSTYNGISKLEKQDNEWCSKPIESIDFPTDNIVFESSKIVWATHPYKGLYRIHLNEDYTKAVQIEDFQENENLSRHKSKIYNVQGKVIIYNSNKWLQYFHQGDSIGVYKRFKRLNGQRLISQEKQGYWFQNNTTGAISFYNNKLKNEFNIATNEIKKRSMSEFQKARAINDSIRTINLSEGFVKFDINQQRKRYNIGIATPEIDKIYSIDKQISVTNFQRKIPYNDGKLLTFEVYTPGGYGYENKYYLSGKREQQGSFKGGKLILQNLDFGKYKLSIINEKNAEKEISFEILPPRYLSNTAIVIYFILSISALYLLYRINDRNIKKKEFVLRRMMIEKMQKKTSELEKKMLKQKIVLKQRELINATDSMIRKNEISMILYNELKRLSNEVSSINQPRVSKILRFSKKNMSAYNDWKVFETNFNELNEDFFKKLIAQQPKLTSKDLRICAYIQMGLTSKKISPLMGISLRGVEIHRYRIRKKLGIPSEERTIEFLNQL